MKNENLLMVNQFVIMNIFKYANINIYIICLLGSDNNAETELRKKLEVEKNRF